MNLHFICHFQPLDENNLKILRSYSFENKKKSSVEFENQIIIFAHLFYCSAFYFITASSWEIIMICVVRLANLHADWIIYTHINCHFASSSSNMWKNHKVLHSLLLDLHFIIKNTKISFLAYFICQNHASVL